MASLVTGGGGFLGSAIVRMLHARGEDVRVLGRGNYPHIADCVSRFFQGDIRDADAVGDACRDVYTVFHVAAMPRIWGRRRDFESIHIDGTRNVIAACRECDVRKLIFTSTPSVVFGDGRESLCDVDESQPYPTRYLADYPRTKAIAERMVLEANGDSLLTVALRPHLIWGPGDPHLIPRIVAAARAGKLRQIGGDDTLVDVTYIDNAAHAHALAADALKPGAACAGRAYFISQGEPVQLWPWLNKILAAVGAPTITRRMSYGRAYRIGAMLEIAYRLLHLPGEPRMTRFLAAQLAHSHYFDISAARRDLGYEPLVSTEAGEAKLIEWLLRQEV